MSKIYVRITGGLGNQIFQVLKAYKLHLESGKPVMLVDSYQNDFFRSKSLRESDFRKFTLTKLGIVDNKIFYHHSSPGSFCNFIFKFRIAKILGRSNIFKVFGNIYLDGYFIKHESFRSSDLQPLIDKIYSLHNVNLKKGAAIHVRAGDLLRQPQNLLITKDYYMKSIEILNSKHDVTKLLIVTENIEYAKTFFADLDKKYSLEYQSSSEINDFVDLLSYEYMITANSTFSWIAGLLGVSKIFISTEYFYIPGDKPNKLRRELVLGFNGNPIK